MEVNMPERVNASCNVTDKGRKISCQDKNGNVLFKLKLVYRF